MKNLILYCHPNPKSFNHAILETVTNELKTRGEEVIIRDLYAMNFDPVKKTSDFEDIQQNRVSAEIEAEQKHLLWANRMILIYPVWWMNMPGLLKGYIDRVFSYGFAYTYNFRNKSEFQLAGKEVLIFNTTGAPKFYYHLVKAFSAMNKTSDSGIFRFCKMKVLGHHYFGSIPRSTEGYRKRILKKVEKIIQKLKK